MNILESIKECEGTAAQLRADAAAAARDELREGERETERLAREIVEAANASAEKAVAAARELSEKKAADFIAEQARADSALVESASARLDAAAAYICEGVLTV